MSFLAAIFTDIFNFRQLPAVRAPYMTVDRPGVHLEAGLQAGGDHHKGVHRVAQDQVPVRPGCNRNVMGSKAQSILLFEVYLTTTQ